MVDPIVYELSSDCRCTKYDSDTDSEVLDENGDPVPAEYCHGCWQDDLSNTEYDIIEPWKKANGISDSDSIHISVNRATWQNVSGYGVGEATLESIIKLLTFDGDWTLKFTYDGEKTLTAQRWSHDEPTGTGVFQFRLATDDEVESWRYR